MEQKKGLKTISFSWLITLTLMYVIKHKKKPERLISVVDIEMRFWYCSVTSNLLLHIYTLMWSYLFLMQTPSDVDVNLSPDESSFWFPYPSDPEPPPVCHTITSPDQSRLWQPHTAEPVWWRGAAGPPPAGRAHSKHMHVTVEGRCSPGLAGGCHGNAHVHPSLLWKRQKWQGTPFGTSCSLAVCLLHAWWFQQGHIKMLFLMIKNWISVL